MWWCILLYSNLHQNFHRFGFTFVFCHHLKIQKFNQSSHATSTTNKCEDNHITTCTLDNNAILQDLICWPTPLLHLEMLGYHYAETILVRTSEPMSASFAKIGGTWQFVLKLRCIQSSIPISRFDLMLPDSHANTKNHSQTWEFCALATGIQMPVGCRSRVASWFCNKLQHAPFVYYEGIGVSPTYYNEDTWVFSPLSFSLKRSLVCTQESTLIPWAIKFTARAVMEYPTFKHFCKSIAACVIALVGKLELLSERNTKVSTWLNGKNVNNRWPTLCMLLKNLVL